jgi:hypothetical protein
VVLVLVQVVVRVQEGVRVVQLATTTRTLPPLPLSLPLPLPLPLPPLPLVETGAMLGTLPLVGERMGARARVEIKEGSETFFVEDFICTRQREASASLSTFVQPLLCYS